MYKQKGSALVIVVSVLMAVSSIAAIALLQAKDMTPLIEKQNKRQALDVQNVYAFVMLRSYMANQGVTRKTSYHWIPSFIEPTPNDANLINTETRTCITQELKKYATNISSPQGMPINSSNITWLSGSQPIYNSTSGVCLLNTEVGDNVLISRNKQVLTQMYFRKRSSDAANVDIPVASDNMWVTATAISIIYDDSKKAAITNCLLNKMNEPKVPDNVSPQPGADQSVSDCLKTANIQFSKRSQILRV